MATENDKPADSGKIEVSGKGWRVYAPVALIATLLANGGSFAGCAKQDDIVRKLDSIEQKLDKHNDKINRIDVRVARMEGVRGAGSQ